MVSESKVFAPIFPIYFTDLAFLKVNLIRKDQGQEGIQQPFLYPLSPGLLPHVQQTAITSSSLPFLLLLQYLWKSFLLLFTSLARFTFKWDLAFLILFLHGQCLYIPHGSPVPSRVLPLII